MDHPQESPWASLSPELVPLMNTGLLALRDEIVRVVRGTIPEYAPGSGDTLGPRIVSGVELALREFVERVAAPDSVASVGPVAEGCRELGRAEMKEGRGLDSLHAAYRLGARLAWRRFVDTGRRERIPPSQMYALAEALFVYIDELTGYTVQGYLEEQARTAGEAERRRQRLVEALTGETPLSPRAVAELARSAGWPLPRVVQAVALTGPALGKVPARGTPRPPVPDALGNSDGPEPFWLIPDPGPGTRAAVERALAGHRAAVGLAMPLADSAVSLRSARRLLALARRGFASGTAVPHCADHLPSLLLLQDQALIGTLSARRLAPLRELTVRQRDRLAETLLAWLQHGGSAPEVARAINVHPQTVRYRVRQLDHLFGPALRDPDIRFELEIALRAESLRATLQNPQPPAARYTPSPDSR
ncbi:PucR family transcriptional regulator [Streptomyces mauvecolor]|uniref:helix-turn-helix domain-containing protein n=1 Tax=Streptomyces sp. HUAS TT7 TaxID=3447507 RepID=UPI003F65A3F3